MSRTIQRFLVVGELGRGGMGVVYRALDPRLDREVAIKLLERPAGAPVQLSPESTVDLRDRPSQPDDLLAEARMMARLSHPNVLPIYEVGLDGDHVFLVMEMIEGENLRGYLARPHTQAEIIDVLAQAARGLAAAHARGIVHRDFKPDNVLLGSDGRVRVCDFGLANVIVGPELVTERRVCGTPAYMAPELFERQPATRASDVFALCRTIAEAFGGHEDPRGLPEALRALVLAGLDDDPGRRPTLDALIAVLRPDSPPRRRRWPWLVVAGGVTAAAAISIAASAASGSSCATDHVLDGRWDEAVRAALLHRLARGPAAGVATTLHVLDAQAAKLRSMHAGVCVAREHGQLGGAQAAVQASCLERRAIEFGVQIARVVAHPEWDFGKASELAMQASLPDNCTEVTAPAIRIDRARVVDLWRRLVTAADLPAASRIAVVEPLEREARADGEAEAAVIAAMTLANTYGLVDRLDDADRAFDRAYAQAAAIGSVQLQAVALIHRTRVAALRGAPVAAESYAKLASTLVDRPTLHPRTRVRIYAMLAMAEVTGGHPKDALPLVETARRLIDDSPLPMDDLEGQLRLDQLVASFDLEGATPAVLALAREDVEWARVHLGPEDADYGLLLDDLASVQHQAGDIVAAVATRRRALAVISVALGPDNAETVRLHDAVATDLLEDERADEALAELARVRADTERNESARRLHAMVLDHVGIAMFMLGRFDEGLADLQRALDEQASQSGADHPLTQNRREDLIGVLLEAARLDDAERQIAALEAGLQHRQEDTTQANGRYRAQVLLGRGALRDAEQLARSSLAAATEARRPDRERAAILATLGTVLAAEHRWPEARTTLEQALAIDTRIHLHAADVADVQAPLAEVLLALGDRAHAGELVRTASAATAKAFDHIRTRRLLARLR